jgi:hypothetical protein
MASWKCLHARCPARVDESTAKKDTKIEKKLKLAARAVLLLHVVRPVAEPVVGGGGDEVVQDEAAHDAAHGRARPRGLDVQLGHEFEAV